MKFLLILAATCFSCAAVAGDAPFFTQCAEASRVVIRAHADVSPEAIAVAQARINRMLCKQPVVAENLAALNAEMQIIGKDQQTTDLPAWRHQKGKAYDSYGTLFSSLDERARGLGGIEACCSEENLLALPCDRFKDHRDICSHEFAHTIYQFGIHAALRARIDALYARSVTKKGLWKTAYASTNANEYFAELTMWYFDSRGDYGQLSPAPQPGPDWLRAYDPEAFALLDDFYSGRVTVCPVSVETLPLLAPAEIETLRSKESRVHTELIIRNATAEPIEIFWKGIDGSRTTFAVTQPGCRFSISTFSTHLWVITRQRDGTVLGGCVPGEASIAQLTVE